MSSSSSNFSASDSMRVYICWGVALMALMISLIFSEILKYPPCTLCWYQRVFMYPLAFIFPVGILTKDWKVFIYGFLLSTVGWVISGYHSLIYHDIIAEAIKVCDAQLSCKTKQFELFGILSIPVMSFLSFTLILILNFIGVFRVKRN